MALTTEEKQEIINKFQRNEDDTGSSEVRIALLTKKIDNLTDHLNEHPNDTNPKRSLLKMVGQRRKLLDYLKDKDKERYEKLIDELRLRK